MPTPDPDPSTRLAVGTRPVNRRTHRASVPAAEEAPEVVQQRLQQLRARHELGRPLSAGPQVAPPRAPLPLAARVQAGVGVVSLSGALFVAQPWGVGVLVVVGAASLAWAGRGLWRQRRPPAMQAAAVLPTEALASLDDLLARAAPAVPEAARAVLQGIKAQLAQAQQPGALAGLGAQDLAYVHQAAARYLPDSLQAYLRLPAERRAAPLAAGEPSADEALLRQLTAVHEGLGRRVRTPDDEAAEALLRQQRFLDAKARE